MKQDYLSKSEKFNSLQPPQILRRFIRISLVVGVVFLFSAFIGAEWWYE